MIGVGGCGTFCAPLFSSHGFSLATAALGFGRVYWVSGTTARLGGRSILGWEGLSAGMGAPLGSPSTIGYFSWVTAVIGFGGGGGSFRLLTT